ncbi:aldehyde dehydrogenase (NADP(+)) [Actinacidiphila bryophytorum]|uniref:2,5-dioxovalerate dehydrogenase n=1 Tax=Actinacidiphila bryophytorum TaxID=1436133 RepID=A0A9W4H062_9ACTN|nr:aldehyde dehydrogenase (NADP(+)) [Actinacidiphila bryophytorum]MBM9436118.1 aldehyde dehydrogenase (NADP(+)) [Actinacidiphila bryophytorum]MBN6543727.1 aldehyde dehydrogenase (NADP(+)) [Actinacidiphila bryophytorum]CAG7634115.1 NADP-dependent fatty aldehyde dehydrogenase [Actinacidiphila bryophytorum]
MAVPVWSVDPRTGKQREQVAVEATAEDVDAAVRAAAAAIPALADRSVRSRLLRAAAGALEESAADVVATADAETALGAPRLTGELARTAYQLRAFADVVDEGAFLDVIIDHADPAAQPIPRPDLRRMKIPLGVVAVYAASNFPLAFSVPGGDTASALAAGCPVVVKAHPDHPATSALCAGLLRGAAESVGLPADTVVLLHGFQAGVELVRHPAVAAAGFTGSVPGGRALYDAAAARPQPIPFYGELGSLNPVVVTEAAAAERAEQIGTGLAGSFTLGVGQFCTKPGLVLAPAGSDGDRLVAALTGAADSAAPGVLLDSRMRTNFLAGAAARAALPGVSAPVAPAGEGETGVRPGFVTVPAAELTDLLLEECFGPLTVVVRYGSAAELSAVLDRLPGNLTATAHLGTAEAAEEDGPAATLLSRLTAVAGRVLVNGWPTGVAVAPAQHHGGPYPATTSTSTSVGATAIERWLRPVTYQDTPPALLPAELRESNPLSLPRRVDGVRS